MKLSKKTKVCASICILLGGVCWFSRSVFHPKSVKQENPSATAQAGSQTASENNASDMTEASALSTAISHADEVAATRRMYAEHAPLRAPELSNPDSATNRRILQTMVEKAMRQNSETEVVSDTLSQR